MTRKFLSALVLCCISVWTYASGIKLQVTDSTSRQPLAGVLVSISNTAITAITGSDGRCHFDQLPAGKISLVFTAENYHPKIIHVTLTQGATLSLNAAMERFEVDLKEVVITSQLNPRSDQLSRLTEKNAITTVDIASGDLIDHTGSISAADVTQHIQGLSVTRTSTGNSDKAIIRGMEAKYSYTLIDGFKIPSPDDKSRYVSLDLFPAGLLQSIQAYKTLTADMEGDAIGGVVNMVTRRPPDEPLLQVNLSTGYSGHYFDNPYRSFNSGAIQTQSPYERFGPGYYATGTDFTKDNLSFHNSKPLPDVTASMLLGHQYLNKKLNFIASVDYKNIKTGADGLFIPLNTQPNLNNVPTFSDFFKQAYNNNKIAISTHEQLLFRPNDRHTLTLGYFYLNQRDVESRNSIDTSLILGRSSVGTGRIYIGDRSRVHTQQINNVSLKGDHIFNALQIDWTGVFSQANGRYPDWSELTANTGRLVNPDGSISQTPLLLAPLNRVWLGNKERDLDVYLDLHYKPALFHQRLILGAGGLLRDKTRDNFYNNYIFNPVIAEPFTDIYHATWIDNPQDPLGNINSPNSYTAKEKIDAVYLMARYQSGRSEFTGGIRLEHTNQHVVSELDPNFSYGKIINIDYRDWLPDLHWKYVISDHQQLKASYFKGISRPALYNVTFANLSPEDYVVAGNPFLKRTQADNFDLTYTRDHSKAAGLKASVFYKHIVDAYERTLINGNDELYPIPQNGLDYTPAGQLTQQLKNTGNAVNYGAEISYNYNLRNLTLSGSYTFTSSSITRMKKLLTRQNPNDPSSNLVAVTRPQTSPLEGQSKHLANINLLYKNVRGKWLANVSAIYTGRRIDLVSPWYGLDYWQRQNISLNLSAEKKLDRHFSVKLSISNLLNTGVTDDILTPNPNVSERTLPGQTRRDVITVLKQNYAAYYMLGLHYQL